MKSTEKQIRKKERVLIQKLMKDNIRGIKSEVTDEEIDFFIDNPDELDRLTNPEAIKKIYLKWALFIGFLLVVFAIITRKYALLFPQDGLMNTLISDLMFESGIALFGAAVTVYLLEILIERQEYKNEMFRRELKASIEKKISSGKEA